MPFRRERDRSLAGTVEKVDSVRVCVNLLAQQVHSSLVEYERIVEKIARATAEARESARHG